MLHCYPFTVKRFYSLHFKRRGYISSTNVHLMNKWKDSCRLNRQLSFHLFEFEKYSHHLKQYTVRKDTRYTHLQAQALIVGCHFLKFMIQGSFLLRPRELSEYLCLIVSKSVTVNNIIHFFFHLI